MSTEKTIDTTRGARGRASKKSIATRDVMTVAAMMVLTFLVCMVTGPLTMPFPFVYLSMGLALLAIRHGIFGAALAG